MRNTYWRRWHLVMMSLPLARVCLYTRSFPLCAEWRKSERSVDGEPQGNWRWNSNSRDVGRFPFTKHFEKPPWKGPSREERVNLTQVPFAEMVSSPKFKMVAQISPWIAWNCWFLSKIRKWNMHFHWKVSKAKTGLRFQFSSYSLDFSSSCSSSFTSQAEFPVGMQSSRSCQLSFPGRIKVGRWNERVRAKRCDAVDWDSA